MTAVICFSLLSSLSRPTFGYLDGTGFGCRDWGFFPPRWDRDRPLLRPASTVKMTSPGLAGRFASSFPQLSLQSKNICMGTFGVGIGRETGAGGESSAACASATPKTLLLVHRSQARWFRSFGIGLPRGRAGQREGGTCTYRREIIIMVFSCRVHHAEVVVGLNQTKF
jgi:hypothetical protein